MSNIIDRRMRLKLAFAPQAIATSGEHTIAEMRWFPVQEPVSGSRYAFLRVKTHSGLTGWGECAEAAEREAKALEKGWLGRSATMYAGIDRSSPLAGALDMALLDIVGKSCRAPVYRVLGGPTRHKVRAFTDSNAAAFSAAGIAVPKPASRNQGKAYENQVLALVKELPEDRDFVLSGGGSLTAGDAASVARAVEGLHPLVVRRALFGGQCRGGPQSLRRDGDAFGLRPRDHRCGRISNAACARV